MAQSAINTGRLNIRSACVAFTISESCYGNGTRELFNQAVEQINEPESPLLQAWGLYVFNRLGMLGIRKYAPGSFAPTTIGLGKGLNYGKFGNLLAETKAITGKK